MPPLPSPFFRPLAPISSAFTSLRNSLFTPPQTTIEGVSDQLWPNPLQPVQPFQPVGGEPLRYPMNWGQNLIFTQRTDARYSADQLRDLARYIIARICIDNTKDILSKMPWRVQPKAQPNENKRERAKRAQKDPNISKLTKFFERPNPQQDWPTFIRPVLEDLLVLDAPTIYIERNKKDFSIAGLRWVEGASITVLVEQHGWTPPPPSPAYQQTWQGYPRVEMTTDQLVYRPNNICPLGIDGSNQASFLYGLSPTEGIAKEIEIGIARLQFVYDFYAQGTVPGAILFAPVGTSPNKIKEAQNYIDSDLAGNLAKRRRIQIFQGFQTDGKTEQTWQPKEPILADVFDELHIRKICFAFGTSPMRLMRMMNRGSSQTVQEASEEEGTLPWMDWVRRTMNHIVQILMKMPDYEFAFDPFVENDVKKLAEADEIDIKDGLYTRNEKREARGDDPIDSPEADELTVVTSTGVIPLRMAQDIADAEIQSRKAKSPIQSTSTTKVEKTNGHTTWLGCKKHQDSYPRVACADCVRSEKDRYAKISQEQNQVSQQY